MDLRQLRYFIAIVDEESITAAAQRLNVAQPALSQSVRKLEEDLGVRLLTRGAQGVRPTEAGQRLYEHAHLILRNVADAVDDVRGYAAEPHGPVSIGLPASVALVLAVPVVEAVRQQLPHVSLRLVEGLSGNILEWLNGGRLDLAMLYDMGKSRTLATEPLLTEDLYVICPPGVRSDDITFDEIAKLPLVIPSRPHGLRERLERSAREAGASLQVAAEIDGLPQIKALVMRGVGFAVLSLSAVRDEWRVRALEARLIVDPQLKRTVSLCVPKSRPLSGAAAAVRQVLLKVMRDLVAREVWPGKALF